MLVIDPNKYTFYDSEGKELKKGTYEFTWAISQEESVQDYPHYMIKEIHEQPISTQRLINSLDGEQHDKIRLRLLILLKNSKRVVFTAAGSSYYASLLGIYLSTQSG